MPFLLNEEAALKSLLSGMTVADAGNAARPVAVFYGQPDKEIRQQSYPYITLDLIGIYEATERVQSGDIVVPYAPEGWDGVSSLKQPYPMPINLDYQVTTFSRQPRHDRQMLAQLFSPTKLPVRFGQLYVPEDNTWRRLETLGFSKRDTTEADKRLFMNVFSIRLTSELFRFPFDTVEYPVTERVITRKVSDPINQVPASESLYNTLLTQQGTQVK